LAQTFDVFSTDIGTGIIGDFPALNKDFSHVGACRTLVTTTVPGPPDKYRLTCNNSANLNTFTAAGPADWNFGGNWSGGVVPISTDNVYIPSGKLPDLSVAGPLNPINDLLIDDSSTLTI